MQAEPLLLRLIGETREMIASRLIRLNLVHHILWCDQLIRDWCLIVTRRLVLVLL